MWEKCRKHAEKRNTKPPGVTDKVKCSQTAWYNPQYQIRWNANTSSAKRFRSTVLKIDRLLYQYLSLMMRLNRNRMSLPLMFRNFNMCTQWSPNVLPLSSVLGKLRNERVHLKLWCSQSDFTYSWAVWEVEAYPKMCDWPLYQWIWSSILNVSQQEILNPKCV